MAARAMSELLSTLVALFSHIFGLALIAFGGVSSVLPGIHRMAVDEEHWMTDRDFANLFALSSISPGPNFLVVTLIGFKAAGVAGAAVATFALCAPTSLLTYVALQGWERFRPHWRIAVRRGLVPVTTGFIGVTCMVLVRASDASPVGYAISAMTVAVALFTRVNPLWAFAAAAAVGALGLV
jgi:chromate transporter